MVDLRLLDSKLSQLINNSTSTSLSKVTRQINQGETFRLNGKTVKALTSASNGEDVLVFKNSSDGAYYCIAGRKETNQVVSERTILSRHTKPNKKLPPKDLCRILRIAYLYKVINEDKSQSFYLVDFSGNSNFVMTIPAATQNFDGATWTFETTYPGYTYKTYELYQSYQYNVFTNEIFSISNNIRDPGEGENLNGYEPPVTFISEVTYGPDYDLPRPLVVDTTNFGLQQVWEKAMYRYNFFTPWLPAEYPPYQSFGISEPIGDGDDWLNWSEVYNEEQTTISYVKFADDNTPAIDPNDGSGAPWGKLNPAYSGGNQNNPQVTNVNISATLEQYNIASARWFVVEYDGPVTVFTPPGQAKPEPVSVPAEVEARLSYSNGKLSIIIRHHNRLPGELPENWDDDENSPTFALGYFTDVDIFKFENGGVVAGANEDLPGHLQLFNDSRPLNNLLQILESQAETIKEKVEVEMLRGSINNDFLPVGDTSYSVDSGVSTVWTWAFNLIDASILEDLIFEEEDFTAAYEIYPIHFVEDEVLGSAPLPLKNGLDLEKARVQVKNLEDKELLDPEFFDVVSVTASFNTRNTVYECHDTSQIETPNPNPGS